MKSKFYLILLMAVVSTAFLAACSSSPVDNSAQLEKLKAEQAALTKQIATLETAIMEENPGAIVVKGKEVGVTELTPRKFDHYAQTQGSVESEENVMVSSKTMGMITNVMVREGEMVTKGQSLAQIDNTLIVRGIEELKSQLELTNTIYERQKNLWDQKIGTEVQYLQAKTTKESLEKRLASMNEQNDMTKIKSPINGVVDAIEVKVGQNIAPGMPAARVVNNSEMKIVANISESYVSLLKKGDKIIIEFPGLDKTVQANLSFVARNIDRLSRTFVVEASLPSSPDFRPNMTVVVKVIYKTESAAIVVPVNVVQSVNNESVVYLAETDGKNTVARRRVVTVGGVFDNLAQISSGVSAGEKLITFGYQGLNDGEVIKM
ncbi:MAG: efflux RND transporter periplasmic adaptor subunit [Bacteroidia bacterium]|nr:efflux RND transporter periplasmic adaptor subunit [Bacteroidia bacterium]